MRGHAANRLGAGVAGGGGRGGSLFSCYFQRGQAIAETRVTRPENAQTHGAVLRG